MKRFKHLLFILSLLVVTITSCKKDSIIPPSPDYKVYYPLVTGQYRIYDVDSIQFYDVTLTSDTFHFQIKEEVDSVVMYEDGFTSKTWYEVKVYRRTDSSQVWQQTGYAMQGISNDMADRIQNNLHIIKMSFPVALGRTWKGNAFLTDSINSTIYNPDLDYSYTTLDTTINYQNNVYDSCAVVTSFDSQNLITKDIEREIYSYGIGLVYKNSTHVERQTIVVDSWIPEKGAVVTYRLLEHN